MTIEIKNPLVRKEDITELTQTFNQLHHALVDEDDKALLKEVFNKANSIIGKYAEEAVVATTESRMCRNKMAQMKLATAGVAQAVRNFKFAAG
jgi:hypothetical protein